MMVRVSLRSPQWTSRCPASATRSLSCDLQVGNLLSDNFDQIYILNNDMVLDNRRDADYYVNRVGLYATNNSVRQTLWARSSP
jgi:hypothetical protein